MKSNTLQIQLSRMEWVAFPLHPKTQAVATAEEPSASWNYAVTLESHAHPHRQEILTAVKCILSAPKSQQPAATAELVFAFRLSNYNDLIDAKGGRNEIPTALLEKIHPIAYDTARGMLFQQFMGTDLRSAVLPLVGPKEWQFRN
jgi:hypothetical protein